MMTILLLIPVLISVICLLRTGLILIGLLKGPILQTFESYGDDEPVYYPLPTLLLWGGILVMSLGAITAQTLTPGLNTRLIGLAMLSAAYITAAYPFMARRFPQLFMGYPRWYYALHDRTTRYERRRLAYMWLWLPRRLRMSYNGNDQAFNQWADLVIMSTMNYDQTPGIDNSHAQPEQYEYEASR